MIELLQLSDKQKNISKIQELVGINVKSVEDAKSKLFDKYRISRTNTTAKQMTMLLRDLDIHQIEYRLGRAS